MLNGCPYSLEQVISSNIGSKSYPSLLPSLHQNFHCGVGIRVVDKKVNIDKPYIDVMVHGYIEWLQFFKLPLCITFELQNDRLLKISKECVISINGNLTCLMRLNIPLTWFPTPGKVQVDEGMSKKSLQNYQKISGSYSISSIHCYPPNRKIINDDEVLLKTEMSNMESTVLDERYNWSISLRGHKNISLSQNSLSTLFLHFNYQKSFNNSGEMDKLMENGTLYIKIKLDLPTIFNLETASTLSPEVWGMRIEKDNNINNNYITFILWLNNVEAIKNGWEGILFGLTIKNIEDKEIYNNKYVNFPWSIQATFIREDLYNETEMINLLNYSKKRQINSTFLLYNDTIEKVGIITRQDQIINTAILSNTQISTSLRIFGIYNSGKFVELSSNVQCTSSEGKILKTSPSCAMVYVDGSESRGSSSVTITAKYLSVYGKINFKVWYPKFPLKIWVEDDILNAIQDWSVAVWKWLNKRKKRKREAKTFACRERFQQSEVKVLSNFNYINTKTGEEYYLTGSKNKYLDVTSLVINKITIENDSIAEVRKIHNKLIILPKKSGVSRIIFKKTHIPIPLASTVITVTLEPVSINYLWLEPIVNIAHHIEQTENEEIYNIHKIVKNEFNHRYERGILDISLQFADSHYLSLGDIPNHEYTMNILPNDGERILAINKKYNHGVPELIALSDLSDVQVTVNIKSQETCKGIDSAPLISGQLVIPIFFPIEDSKRIELETVSENENEEEIRRTKKVEELFKKVEQIEEKKSSFFINVHPFILFIFLLLALILIIQLINCSSSKLHNGYEKLVAPIFARLNSNQSLSEVQKVEDTSKEWIWLPRSSPQQSSKNFSFGSQYSEKSTVGISEKGSSGSSPDDNLNRSISVSYRGSEISVFLSPNASMAIPERIPLVHGNNQFQYTSWRTGRKNERNRNYYANIESSNSETNLKKWNTEHRSTHPAIHPHGILNYEYNQPSEKVIAGWREYQKEDKRKNNKLVHLTHCSLEESSRASPTYDSDEELLLDRPMKTGDLVHKYFFENTPTNRSGGNDTTSLGSKRRSSNQLRSIDRRSFHLKESIA
uniref:TMEM132 domain-containing protein n=1 Tax=Parastrongyloides trichosuri TaxID=131310 RepID=A0A0N4Z717_PARTI